MLQCIRGLHNIQPQHKGGVVTIGNFDGVHLGHQKIIARAREIAHKRNTHVSVIIFEPQPLEYLSDTPPPPRLSRLREKIYLLQKCLVDNVLIIYFNDHFAKMSAKDFIKDVIVDKMTAQAVVIGDDFKFGADRKGDHYLLQQMGSKYGFHTKAEQTLYYDNARISSSRIRLALQHDKFKDVEFMLARPYSMFGRVVYGEQRGQTLGVPTANIYLHRLSSPLQGVYAVNIAGLGSQLKQGVANIGTRPTVDGQQALLEVFIFDFSKNIYGTYVQVSFLSKIREEMQFDNLNLLKKQIEDDIKQAKAYFSLEKHTGKI